MGPIEAWYSGSTVARVRFADEDSENGIPASTLSGCGYIPCLILPNLTAADWDALMALVRAGWDQYVYANKEFGKWDRSSEYAKRAIATHRAVCALPPEIIAAAREGR